MENTGIEIIERDGDVPIINNTTYCEITHRYCLGEESSLSKGVDISAIEFFEMSEIVDGRMDYLDVGEKFTLEEVYSQKNWQSWSERKQLNARYCLEEMIRRNWVNLAVTSERTEFFNPNPLYEKDFARMVFYGL